MQQKPQIFWKHGVVPFHACSFQLIRTRSVRGACGEKERGRILIAPFLLKKMWCLHRNRCVAHVIAEAKVGVAVDFVGRFGRRGKRKLLEKLKEAC